jgi:catechol 2,3-dioxygenase-like lactoylglutathione lyase family enzyme
MGDGTKVLDALGRDFDQVGIVVEDLDRALRAHEGMGPWSVYTYDRSVAPDLQAGGVPADFRFRLALNPGQPQLELIQPLDDRSPYAAWLAAAGSGIHHLGFLVEDVPATTEVLRAAGFELIMSGSGHGADGTGAFAYYDTAEAVGYVTEAIRRPATRREPEAILP